MTELVEEMDRKKVDILIEVSGTVGYRYGRKITWDILSHSIPKPKKINSR